LTTSKILFCARAWHTLLECTKLKVSNNFNLFWAKDRTLKSPTCWIFDLLRSIKIVILIFYKFIITRHITPSKLVIHPKLWPTPGLAILFSRKWDKNIFIPTKQITYVNYSPREDRVFAICSTAETIFVQKKRSRAE